MKYVILFLALLTVPAFGQVSFDAWASGIIDNRVEKRLVPSLVASPDIVKTNPRIANLPVRADPALPSGTLQIKGTGMMKKRKSPVEPEQEVQVVDELMAQLRIHQ